jgi:hypothetical protein
MRSRNASSSSAIRRATPGKKSVSFCLKEAAPSLPVTVPDAKPPGAAGSPGNSARLPDHLSRSPRPLQDFRTLCHALGGRLSRTGPSYLLSSLGQLMVALLLIDRCRHMKFIRGEQGRSTVSRSGDFGSLMQAAIPAPTAGFRSRSLRLSYKEFMRHSSDHLLTSRSES